MIAILGKQSVYSMTERRNILKRWRVTAIPSSAIADHMTQTGHRIKWDHFDILATGQSDIHCKIKEALLIRVLKSALNENIGSEKLLLYQRAFIFFPADLTRSVLVLVLAFKFNCCLGNRYFWRCILEHTKR